MNLIQIRFILKYIPFTQKDEPFTKIKEAAIKAASYQVFSVGLLFDNLQRSWRLPWQSYHSHQVYSLRH